MRSLGAEEVIDYETQDFQAALHGYDAVPGTIRGEELEKATHIMKAGSNIVSLGRLQAEKVMVCAVALETLRKKSC